MARGISRDYPLPGCDPEDVEQEAAFGLLEAARRYEPDRGVSFSRFADIVIRLRLRDAMTKAQRMKHMPLRNALRTIHLDEENTEALIDLLPDRTPQPLDLAVVHEDLRALAVAMRDHLTDSERIAIQGLLNDRPYREIATQISLSGTTKFVDNAVQRARRKLRQAVDP